MTISLLILPDELIILIMKKLYNYDIFNLNLVCRKIHIIIDSKSFIDYILTRYHPIVFNSDDLYCSKCNLHIYRINYIHDIDNIWCRH